MDMCINKYSTPTIQPYDIIDCPNSETKCEWRNQFKHLLGHWSQYHSKDMTYNNRNTFNIVAFRYNHFFLFDDEIYLFKYKLSRKNGERVVRLEMNSLKEHCSCEKLFNIQFYANGEININGDCLIFAGRQARMIPSQTFAFSDFYWGSEESKMRITILKSDCPSLLSQLSLQHANKTSNKVDASSSSNVLQNKKPVKSGKVDSSSSSKVLQHLECPVCYEHMSPPIYQCSNGHLLCSVCSNKMSICPICKVSIVKKVRNLFAEQLSEEVINRCKFKNCDFKGIANVIQEHEKKCILRDIKCPFDECTWTGQFEYTRQHLELQHSKNILKNDNNSINRKLLEVETFIRNFNGCIFVLKQIMFENKFMCAVQKLGPLGDTDEYTYKIVFETEDSSEEISFKLKCNQPNMNLVKPFVKTEIKVEDSMDCSYIRIFKDILEPFERNGIYRYELYFRKLSNYYIF